MNGRSVPAGHTSAAASVLFEPLRIHPDWPKLFEMPLLGYLGFVPFAFSTLALYVLLQRVRPRAATVAALWVAAAATMLALTVIWAGRGFYTPAR